MLKLTYQLSHEQVSSAGASHLHVLLSISAPAIDEAKRVPINLGLVLDKSASMTGVKIDFCRHAARFVAGQLSPDDIFSLVAFDNRVDVIFPAQKVLHKDQIKSAIERIQVGSNTNLSGGWLSSSKEILKNVSPDRTNRIILLTDGQANEGITEPERLFKIAQDLAAKNVTTSAVGFGTDFNEDLLKGIADAGRGNFHFINNPEKAPRVFSEELAELLSLYAQNLVLTISPSDQVKYIGLLHDYPGKIVGKSVQINLGDIFSSEEKILLTEFVIPNGHPECDVGVSVFNLSYQQIYQEVTFKEVSAFVKVGYGFPDEVAKQVINPVVYKELILCEAIKGRKDAIARADSGDLYGARKRIQNSIDNISKSGYKDEGLFKDEIKRLHDLMSSFNTSDSYTSIGRKEALSQSIDSSRKKSSYSSISLSGLRIMPLDILEHLKNSSRVVFITGEGLSSECGSPKLDEDFITLGEKRIENRLTLEALESDRENLFKCVDEVMKYMRRLKPDVGFDIIASMGEYWKHFLCITESTDGLHSKAGNRFVIEIMGNISRLRCPVDGTWKENTNGGEQRCACGSLMRPDIVLKGENPLQKMLDFVRDALLDSQAIWVVGTFFTTAPGLLLEAKERGALLIEINPTQSPLSLISDYADYRLQAKPKNVLPLLWKDIKR